MTLGTLALLQGRTLAREGERLLVRPAPSPEEARALAPFKRPLLALLEEGVHLQGDELLGNLHLLAGLFVARGNIPETTWATFYYKDRPEPERVLAPEGNLLPHLRWRAQNLPASQRVHLAATDGRLTLDLEAPLEAFLQVEGEGRVELYGWPELRLKIYLEAAARGRTNPNHIRLEKLIGVMVEGFSWTDILQAAFP
ncbi:hypothetical protein [Thermus oshimai]